MADCDYWMRAGARHRFVKVNEFLAIERNHATTLRDSTGGAGRGLGRARDGAPPLRGVVGTEQTGAHPATPRPNEAMEPGLLGVTARTVVRSATTTPRALEQNAGVRASGHPASPTRNAPNSVVGTKVYRACDQAEPLLARSRLRRVIHVEARSPTFTINFAVLKVPGDRGLRGQPPGPDHQRLGVGRHRWRVNMTAPRRRCDETRTPSPTGSPVEIAASAMRGTRPSDTRRATGSCSWALMTSLPSRGVGARARGDCGRWGFPSRVRPRGHRWTRWRC